MRKTFVLIVSIIFFTCCSNPDSPKKDISKENDISKRVDQIFQLSARHRTSIPDSSLFYTNKAIGLLKMIDDPARMSKAEWYLCSYHYAKGHTDSGLAIAEKNIAWLKDKPKLESLLGQFYSSSGLFFMKLDKRKEALDRFYIALKTAENANDTMTQLKAYVNIGWAMMELNQYEQAVSNFNKTIIFIREHGLSQTTSGIVYSNLASSYGSLGKVDSAYKYANIAVQISQINKDLTNEANALFILGKTLQKMKRMDEALQSFLKGQAIRERQGDLFFTVSDLSEISTHYSMVENTKEGIATAERALEIAKANNITAKLPMIYEALAANYEASKDFEKATAVYKKINDLKDSAYSDANPRAVAEMQAKYETEKKQRTIEKQHDRIARQNLLFIGIAILALITAWLVWSLYKRYKQKKETQLHAEIMKQQELSVKAVLKAEEEERQRIARDLHDGVGQMMSAAKMNLSAFESEIKFNTPEQKDSFGKIIELVDDSCKEMRHVSHNMMPNSLLKNNLASALSDFLNKIDKKALDIHLYTEGLDNRIDINIESVLYRIIQECVNNVIKHSGATTLDISVIRDKDGISATIEDNGKGFDTNDKEKFEGIGLKNILTRVEYLKGAVEFDSRPGRGTAIGLHVAV